MIAGVARNTTYKNDINTSKKAEILEDKLSKTLVESVDNTTQAKKPRENGNNIIEIDLQNKVNMAKNAKIKENSKTKEIKGDKGKESNTTSCPMNATIADLLTKPLAKANIRKIHNTIKSINGQQECVGLKPPNNTTA
jgi:hypothetical protein